VIPKLDGIFSRQGIPQIVKSDNGPPFNSIDFANFASYLGFEHRKVTPYWPQANGEVERFMRTLEKAIRTANLEKKNWKQEMNVLLRQYRVTLIAPQMCHLRKL
jgi:transposase InsO family protein